MKHHVYKNRTFSAGPLDTDVYREIPNYLKVLQCIIAVSLLRVISGESDLLLMKLALLIRSNLAGL